MITHLEPDIVECEVKWPLGSITTNKASGSDGIPAAVASLVAQMVKNPPAMWETQVRSLGWEDPLEKEMAPHSSTIAWRIPWREEPGRI